MSTLGSIRVTATCNNQTKTLPILVIKGNGPNLMGRDWLSKLAFVKTWNGPDRTEFCMRMLVNNTIGFFFVECDHVCASCP